MNLVWKRDCKVPLSELVLGETVSCLAREERENLIYSPGISYYLLNVVLTYLNRLESMHILTTLKDSLNTAKAWTITCNSISSNKIILRGLRYVEHVNSREWYGHSC